MVPKHPTLAAGLLTVLGLVGHPTPCVGAWQDPGPPSPPATTTAAPSGPPTVLLLSNGQVRHGEILKDANGYFVKQKFGTTQYPKRSVERTFRSLREAYEYKKSLCPEQDADERMKLASWCIEQKLMDEAKAELAAVQELSPENRQAKAILATLSRTDALPPGSVDPSVARAGVDVETPPPADLSLTKLREEFARNPQTAGMPAIFDLDVPLAVRRYGEFARNVHPILQKRCAKCHNENTPGEFQMIQTRTSRDLANSLVLQANLEATLRIVDRDDLARSPILTASGMVHDGTGGKPVLGGPQTAEYRALAAWVTSLKAAESAPVPSPKAATSSAASPPAEGFAAGRLAPGRDPAMPPSTRAPQPKPQKNLLLAPPPVDLSPDRTVFSENGAETKFTPSPAGFLIPGSGTSQTTPPPEAFLPPEKPEAGGKKVPPKPGAPDAKPGEALPEGMVRMADGRLGMKIPGTNEIVPVVTKDETLKKTDDAATKGKAFDKKKLESFVKARPKK